MVSVCIATYNGERFIRGQIESILPQLNEEDELVISDDNSKDRTIEILKSYNDSRIKIFKGPAKFHPRYNFENCLNHCSGDFIFMCDQDDIWEPNRINIFLEHLKENDVVVCDCSVVDAENNIISESFMQGRPSKKRGVLCNLFANHYIGCCMGFRRELLSDVLPFPPKVAQHDMWMGLCAEYLGYRIKFIDNKLTRYRRYGDNFSQDRLGMVERFSYRWYLLRHLLFDKTKSKLKRMGL